MMNKIIKNLLICLLIGLILLVLYNVYPFVLKIFVFIKNIILPFFIAFVLAYILEPVVKFFERFFKKRQYAVFITSVLVISVLIILFRITFPFIEKEISELALKMPDIISTLENRLNEFSEKFSYLPDEIKPNFENIKNLIVKYIEKLDFVKVFDSVVFQLGNIILIPVILLYFLVDYEKIIKRLRNFLVKKEKIHFKNYLGKLNQYFSKYIKTTILVILLIVMTSTIVFTFIGLDYPLFFGIIVGITNIIPYIGPYVGGAFPVIYAITTDGGKTLAVLISIIAIQIVESSLITPYLHSKHSQTHPLLIILSLSVCGALFGVLGLIFAVPFLKFIEITLYYYPLKSFPIFVKDNK